MKRLSICLPLLMLVLALSGSGFTRPAPASRQTLYYWFTAPPYESYNDCQTIANETYEMWIYYDVTVDQNPGGGTLIERGYLDIAFPHDELPSIFLYAHFPYPFPGFGAIH
jgi:hypothetical protein